MTRPSSTGGLVLYWQNYKKDYLKRYQKLHKQYLKQLTTRQKQWEKWEKKHRLQLAIGLTIAGINLILISSLYLLYRRTILSFSAQPENITYSTRAAQPTQIQFNDQTVQIEPAQISNGIWQTTDNGASHLSSSANPGETGNIIIYGHNKWNIFSSLTEVKLGDEFTVTSTDGKKHTYLASEIRVVKPTDVDVVYPTESEILTVYTCTGFLDTKRLVIRAIPLDV